MHHCRGASASTGSHSLGASQRAYVSQYFVHESSPPQPGAPRIVPRRAASTPEPHHQSFTVFIKHLQSWGQIKSRSSARTCGGVAKAWDASCAKRRTVGGPVRRAAHATRGSCGVLRMPLLVPRSAHDARCSRRVLLLPERERGGIDDTLTACARA